jgi:hypothetical protein
VEPLLPMLPRRPPGVPLAVRLTGANRTDAHVTLVLVDAIPARHGEWERPAALSLGLPVLGPRSSHYGVTSRLTSRGHVNRAGFIGGLFLREDGAYVPSQQVLPRIA